MKLPEDNLKEVCNYMRFIAAVCSTTNVPVVRRGAKRRAVLGSATLADAFMAYLQTRAADTQCKAMVYQISPLFSG